MRILDLLKHKGISETILSLLHYCIYCIIFEACFRFNYLNKEIIYIMMNCNTLMFDENHILKTMLAIMLYRIFGIKTNYLTSCLLVSANRNEKTNNKYEFFFRKKKLESNTSFDACKRFTTQKTTSPLHSSKSSFNHGIGYNYTIYLYRVWQFILNFITNVKKSVFAIVKYIKKKTGFKNTYLPTNNTRLKKISHTATLLKTNTHYSAYSESKLESAHFIDFYTDFLSYCEEPKSLINMYLKIYQKLNLLKEKIYLDINKCSEAEIENNNLHDSKNVYRNFRTEIEVSLVTASKTPYISHRELIDSIIAAGILYNFDVKLIYINPIKIKEADESEFDKLLSSKGIVLPCLFLKDGIEGQLYIIKYARENDIPFLSICLGFHLTIAEYIINVLLVDVLNTKKDKRDVLDLHLRILRVDLDEGLWFRPMGNNTHQERVRTLANNSHREGYRMIADNPQPRYYAYQDFRHPDIPIDYKAEIFHETDMRITRKTHDQKYILSFKHKKHSFFVGMSWHPEISTSNSNRKEIFSEFICSLVSYPYKRSNV